MVFIDGNLFLELGLGLVGELPDAGAVVLEFLLGLVQDVLQLLSSLFPRCNDILVGFDFGWFGGGRVEEGKGGRGNGDCCWKEM